MQSECVEIARTTYVMQIPLYEMIPKLQCLIFLTLSNVWILQHMISLHFPHANSARKSHIKFFLRVEFCKMQFSQHQVQVRIEFPHPDFPHILHTENFIVKLAGAHNGSIATNLDQHAVKPRK